MGWRDFKFDTTLYVDKVYKEDKVKLLNLPAIKGVNDCSAGTTSETAKVNPKLIDFQTKAKAATSLGKLTNILNSFVKSDWNLLERASMNAEYTETAMRLIEAEDKDKYIELEKLAYFCWQSTKSSI